MERNQINNSNHPNPSAAGSAANVSQSNRDWIKVLPGLLISVIVLAVVLYFVDFRKLVEAIQQANYGLVALGGLASFVWLLIRGMVWHTLLRSKVRYRDVFFAINEGYLLNNLLPFRLGEVGRAFILGNKKDRDGNTPGFWRVFSSILVERALDMTCAVGVLMTSLAFVVGASWARSAALITGAVVLVGLISLYLLARNRAWALAMLEKWGRRFPLVLRLGGGIVPAFLSGISVLTETSRFLRTILWMLANWGMAIVQYYVLLRAFFPQAELRQAVFTLGVAALGIATPSSPGNIGVLEGVIVAALAVFRLDYSTSLAYAVTIHLLQYIITTLLGAYGLSQEGQTLMGLYRQLRATRKPSVIEENHDRLIE